MMAGGPQRGLFLLVAAAVLCGRAARGTDTDAPTAPPPIDAERPAGAVVTNAANVDPQRAAALARTRLVDALEQSDPTARLFALRTAARLRDPVLAEAVRPAARSPDRYERALALELLVNTDPARARAELLEALASPYRAIRLRGLQGLARLRDPSLMDRFDDILTSDPDPDLRVVAVQALLECGTPSAGPLLHRGLDDPVNAVREESVKALVQLGDPGVSAAIRRRIAEDTAPDRRAFALRLAGHVPDPALLKDVVPLLDDANPEVRAAAAGAVLSIAAAAPPAGK